MGIEQVLSSMLSNHIYCFIWIYLNTCIIYIYIVFFLTCKMYIIKYITIIINYLLLVLSILFHNYIQRIKLTLSFVSNSVLLLGVY